MANDDLTARCLKIKRKHEEAKAAAARAAGGLDSYKKQLKDKWGVTSLKAARAKLDKLKTQAMEAREQLEKEVGRLEEKWGDVI